MRKLQNAAAPKTRRLLRVLLQLSDNSKLSDNFDPQTPDISEELERRKAANSSSS